MGRVDRVLLAAAVVAVAGAGLLVLLLRAKPPHRGALDAETSGRVLLQTGDREEGITVTYAFEDARGLRRVGQDRVTEPLPADIRVRYDPAHPDRNCTDLSFRRSRSARLVWNLLMAGIGTVTLGAGVALGIRLRSRRST